MEDRLEESVSEPMLERNLIDEKGGERHQRQTDEDGSDPTHLRRSQQHMNPP
jgi:hypothetical protein